jgi:hypothetical protein
VSKNLPHFIDPLKDGPSEPKKKKQKKSEWELNMVYQERWATRLCWFEPICGEDGKMHMVKCWFYF